MDNYMAVKSAKAGSINALRASVERKGGGNDSFLQRVPADGSITVRFLTEPEDWQSYFEHYDPVMKYYPCSDDCPGCTEGNKPGQRYLANVLNVESGNVIPMVLPKTLVTKLLNSYDRYDTIADRDYELIRLGSGLDTDYDRSPEVPQKRPVKQLAKLDLEEVLENQLKRAFNDGSEDEPAPARPASRPGTGRTAAKKLVAKPIVKEEEAVEEETEVGVDWLSREELEEMSLRELRLYAKAEAGIAPDDIKGIDQDALVELILERTDGVAAKSKEEDDEDSEDAPEEDAEAEDDEEQLTEEDIRGMTLQELRKLCGQLEIAWKRTDGKALLVKKVLETAMSEDDGEPPF